MNNFKIGSFLQALRKAKGLTQQEVAEYFDINNKTVSKWECGDTLPEIPMLVALAEFYEVSVDEILKGERNSTSKPIAIETEEKNRKAREKYLVTKNLNGFKFLYYISLGTVIIGFILAFALGVGVNRFIGFGVGVTFYIASIITFLIASNKVTDQLDEYIEEDLLKKLKLKKFKYSYIFWVSIMTCLPLTLSLLFI